MTKVRRFALIVLLLLTSSWLGAYSIPQALVACEPQRGMIAFTPVGSAELGVRLTDLGTGRTFTIGQGRVSALAFSENGQLLAFSERSRSLQIAEVTNHALVQGPVIKVPYWATALCFLDQERLMVGAHSGRARVVPIDGTTVELLPVHNRKVSWVGTVDGEILALHSDGWLRKWDRESLGYRGRVRLIDKLEGACFSKGRLTVVGGNGQ